MAAEPHPHFARFLRPKSGKPVARYGTATKRAGNDIIGGRWVDDPERRPDPITGERPRKLVIDKKAIVAITHREARRFRREYARAIRNGDLEEATREQWEAKVAAESQPLEEAEAAAEEDEGAPSADNPEPKPARRRARKSADTSKE